MDSTKVSVTLRVGSFCSWFSSPVPPFAVLLCPSRPWKTSSPKRCYVCWTPLRGASSRTGCRKPGPTQAAIGIYIYIYSRCCYLHLEHPDWYQFGYKLLNLQHLNPGHQKEPAWSHMWKPSEKKLNQNRDSQATRLISQSIRGCRCRRLWDGCSIKKKQHWHSTTSNANAILSWYRCKAAMVDGIYCRIILFFKAYHEPFVW